MLYHRLDAYRRDSALALRSIRRSPGFAVVAMLVLGIGIGMATAVFSVLDAVLIRDLPVRDQDRVVVLWGEGMGSLPNRPLRYREFERFRERSRELEGAEGVDYNGAWPRAFRDSERVLSLRTSPVTGGFFDVLGSAPVLGRLFRPEDDVIGAENAMVLSHGAWRREFSGAGDVIGRRLVLHGSAMTYTVVGVAPAGLEYPEGVDAWIPAVPFGSVGRDSTYVLLNVIGRLASGASAVTARAEFQTFLREENQSRGDARVQTPVAAAHPLASLITGDVRPALIATSAAVALLLLIVCINIGNLLLVRALRRSDEITLRRVLGAGYGQIVRQLLLESTVLAVLGGALGLVLARALLRILVALAPPELPQLDRIQVDGAPVGIAMLVTLASAILFGLAPALWAARANLAAPFRGGRSGGEVRAVHRARRALVVWQVALALMIVAAAGLVGRSLDRLQRLDMGFDVDRLTILELSWSWLEYDSRDKVWGLYEALLPAIRALPEVEHVTPVLLTPFSGTGGWDGHFAVEGQSQAEVAANPYINMEAAGPDYFATFDTPILRGRAFTDADREGTAKVVIISEAVARRFWPGEDPLGKRLRSSAAAIEQEWFTVAGVAGETRYRALRAPAPSIYFPYRQFPGVPTMMAVRTRGDAAAVVPGIRSVVDALRPGVVVWKAEPMEGLLRRRLAQPRLSTILLAGFGAVALLLAAIGIYGVVALAVRQRTRELGVRLALGAEPAQLRMLVLREALLTAAAGVALGVGGAVAGSRFLRALLFEISPFDPLVLMGACAVLLAAAVAAAYGPARRATTVEPAIALRSE